MRRRSQVVLTFEWDDELQEHPKDWDWYALLEPAAHGVVVNRVDDDVEPPACPECGVPGRGCSCLQEYGG